MPRGVIWRRIRTLWFLLVFCASSFAGEPGQSVHIVQEGTSREVLLELWGEPAGRGQYGNEEIMMFGDGREVRLRDGIVISVLGGSARQRRPTDVQVQMPAWMEAQMQQMLDAQGTFDGWEAEDLPPWMLAGLAAFWVFVILLMQVSMWKIFTKAGRSGWASLVPLYNAVVMLQIAGKPGWWLLLMLVPGVNFIIVVLMDLGLAERFGKGPGFGLGLLFFPVVFLPILAFGSAQHEDG